MHQVLPVYATCITLDRPDSRRGQRCLLHLMPSAGRGDSCMIHTIITQAAARPPRLREISLSVLRRQRAAAAQPPSTNPAHDPGSSAAPPGTASALGAHSRDQRPQGVATAASVNASASLPAAAVGGDAGAGGGGAMVRDASCVPAGPILSLEKELIRQWRVSNEVRASTPLCRLCLSLRPAANLWRSMHSSMSCLFVCVCVCVCVYMHACMHAYIYIYM